MNIIYPTILAVIVICAYYAERNLYNPTVIFAGMWLCAGVLSQMDLFGFNTVPDTIYTWVIIGVVCFSLGAALRRRFKFKTKKTIAELSSGRFTELRYQFLIPFYFFILVFTSFLASKSISLLLRGVHMETIRFNYSKISAGIVVRTALQYNIEHYIVATAEFAGVALFPIVMMAPKSWKKTILLIELVLFFALHIFVTGARSFVFDIVFVIVVHYLIAKRLSKSNPYYFGELPVFLVRTIGLGAAAMFFVMTSLRRGGLNTIVHEFYSYFTMCFRLFDTHVRLMQANPNYTHGMTLLHGVLRLPLLLLKTIGVPYPSAYQKAVDAINANNVFYAVGRGSGNSFVTLFYYFFMDFGYTGIILGCFVYGYFSQSVYRTMQKRPDWRIQSFYLLIAVGLFLSYTRLHFTAPRYVYAFLLLFFSFTRSSQTNLKDLNQRV